MVEARRSREKVFGNNNGDRRTQQQVVQVRPQNSRQEERKVEQSIELKPCVGLALGSFIATTGILDGGPDIKILETSPVDQRKTAVVLAFKEGKQRQIGAIPLQDLMYHLENTFLYFTRLLDPQNHTREQNHVEYAFDNQQVQVNGHKRLEVQQLVAAFISILMSKQRIDKNNIDNIVLTVPDYTSVQGRQKLLESARIAGLSKVHLISEARAIAYQYASQWRKDITQPRVVLFFDVGHSKTSVSVIQFSQESAKILHIDCQSSIGARDFDLAVTEAISDLIIRENQVEVLNDPRKKVKILTAVKSARETLTHSESALIKIDRLVSKSDDFELTLSREQFKGVVRHLTRDISLLLQNVPSFTGKNNENSIYSIELLGDMSRAPMFQTIIQQALNVRQDLIVRTLNSESCLARGATLKSALIQGSLTGFSYDVYQCGFGVAIISNDNTRERGGGGRLTQSREDPNIFEGEFQIAFESPHYQTFRIFREGTEGAKIVICEQRLYYKDLLKNLTESGYSTRHCDRSAKIAVTIADSEIDLPELKEALVTLNVKTRKNPVEYQYSIPFEKRNNYGLSSDEIEQLRSQEQRMADEDDAIFNVDNLEHQFRSYTQEMKNTKYLPIVEQMFVAGGWPAHESKANEYYEWIETQKKAKLAGEMNIMEFIGRLNRSFKEARQLQEPIKQEFQIEDGFKSEKNLFEKIKKRASESADPGILQQVEQLSHALNSFVNDRKLAQNVKQQRRRGQSDNGANNFSAQLAQIKALRQSIDKSLKAQGVSRRGRSFMDSDSIDIGAIRKHQQQQRGKSQFNRAPRRQEAAAEQYRPYGV